jgi:hypothetical protein
MNLFARTIRIVVLDPFATDTKVAGSIDAVDQGRASVALPQSI